MSYFFIAEQKFQIKTSQVLERGKHKVVSQSKNMIDGFCNLDEKILRIETPVVVFGDHTRVVKYIDFDFVIGADGTKVLTSNYLDMKFLYYHIQFLVNKMGIRNYGRHFKLLKNNIILVPPIEEQKRIVEKLDNLLPLIDALYK